MSAKKVLLFIVAFIFSCGFLTAFNRYESYYAESEVYLVGEYKIELDERINFVFNNDADKKRGNHINLRISGVPSRDLTDTIKIYRVAFYSYHKSTSEISADGNNIIFEEYVGPISYFMSRTFITNVQLNDGYYHLKNRDVYKVEFPKGISTKIKD